MKKLHLLSITLLSILISLSCNNAEHSHEDGSSHSHEKSSVAETEGKEKIKTGYAIGDEATDFKLQNVDMEMVSLSDYPDAKGFIVIFTCNHCPFSVAYEDRINDLDALYKPKGYPVIAISPNDPEVNEDDSFEKMIIRAEEKNFSFPYLFDDEQEIYPQYGATKTPHVFILNKQEGKNIVRYIGTIDDNYEDETDVSEKYVEDAVNSLLAGEEVKVETTVAIGCSIKVKK